MVTFPTPLHYTINACEISLLKNNAWIQHTLGLISLLRSSNACKYSTIIIQRHLISKYDTKGRMVSTQLFCVFSLKATRPIVIYSKYNTKKTTFSKYHFKLIVRTSLLHHQEKAWKQKNYRNFLFSKLKKKKKLLKIYTIYISCNR